MLSTNINLSDATVLCEYVPLDQFKGLLQQRIAISPDLLVVLLRDGVVVHTDHGAHVALGGIWQNIKEAVGGTHALQMLIADLKPFQATYPIAALSQDKVEVQAEVTVELQVDPGSGSNIIGLSSDSIATSKNAVYERLLPHLQDRVFQNLIQQCDAASLRGDTALQDKMQADVLLAVESLMGDLGILVRAVSVNWALNDEEAAQMQARADAREQDLLDAKLNNYSREIERTAEVTRLKVITNNETESITSASDSELRQMLLAQEFEFVDAKESAERSARMKAIEGEIAEIKAETHARLELNIANARNEVDLRQIQMDLQRFDRETEKLDREQQIALDKLAEMEALAVAEAAHVQQARTLRDMMEIEKDGKRADAEIAIQTANSQTERELALARQKDDTDLAKTRLQQNMTPDQILAINAGLSADVANVFAERAKADASSNLEKQALLERLIESGAKSGEDAKYYFEQFKQGVIGVAGGTGTTPEANTPAANVICPQCKAENDSGSRYCSQCSYQIRA
ncbi:MAG: hypothetical protein KTR33_15970 [Gammaproteobacteria bacterium]|nr:hypothetical protein [Gammaproteobacteria bacterium]